FEDGRKDIGVQFASFRGPAALNVSEICATVHVQSSYRNRIYSRRTPVPLADIELETFRRPAQIACVVTATRNAAGGTRSHPSSPECDACDPRPHGVSREFRPEAKEGRAGPMAPRPRPVLSPRAMP